MSEYIETCSRLSSSPEDALEVMATLVEVHRAAPLYGALMRAVDVIAQHGELDHVDLDEVSYSLEPAPGSIYTATTRLTESGPVVSLLRIGSKNGSSRLDVVALPLSVAGPSEVAATWLVGRVSSSLVASAKNDDQAMQDLYRQCRPLFPSSDELAELGESLLAELAGFGVL